ncbi:predicted protein [Naegleria gruberi]|uniref:Predicted protein n=1 Tax=Naegleria gruberi TaxID=5762 RepID=D2VRK6_NAEGR|nr:uncharacterized protein NAEGRDRAFT_51701 [Naegleria gruberi]EFC40409.1 predicted protein [Naegleria gruberi]|eukprot:XP_002673153.1 predicted protein [Naegleria gruberi strain NEG-M]
MAQSSNNNLEVKAVVYNLGKLSLDSNYNDNPSNYYKELVDRALQNCKNIEPNEKIDNLTCNLALFIDDEGITKQVRRRKVGITPNRTVFSTFYFVESPGYQNANEPTSHFWWLSGNTIVYKCNQKGGEGGTTEFTIVASQLEAANNQEVTKSGWILHHDMGVDVIVVDHIISSLFDPKDGKNTPKTSKKVTNKKSTVRVEENNEKKSSKKSKKASKKSTTNKSTKKATKKRKRNEDDDDDVIMNSHNDNIIAVPNTAQVNENSNETKEESFLLSDDVNDGDALTSSQLELERDQTIAILDNIQTSFPTKMVSDFISVRSLNQQEKNETNIHSSSGSLIPNRPFWPTASGSESDHELTELCYCSDFFSCENDCCLELKTNQDLNSEII